MSRALAILVVTPEHFNLYWFLLLLLVSAQSLAAVIGTNVVQKRHHNPWRLTNDLLVRFQLGYISFAVAVFINVTFSPEQKFLSVANGILLVLALVAVFGGFKLASQDRLDEILKNAGHQCPASVSDKCKAPLKLRRKIQLVWGNILAFVILTSLAIFIVRSIKPASLTDSGEIPQKPRGSPIVKVVPNKDQPEWYLDHTFWLQEEGDRHRKGGLIATYALGEVQYLARERTIPYAIVISVPEGYNLASHSAFRVASTNGHPLMERLDPTPSNDAFREFRISVPECVSQDKIIVLFRLDSKYVQGSINVTDIVRAHLEGGE